LTQAPSHVFHLGRVAGAKPDYTGEAITGAETGSAQVHQGDMKGEEEEEEEEEEFQYEDANVPTYSHSDEPEPSLPAATVGGLPLSGFRASLAADSLLFDENLSRPRTTPAPPGSHPAWLQGVHDALP
jgi:hypothetical protein